ncbi:MAG: protease inhibitor I42 family protein [Desulfovibrionaceae bacterium]|nr:protease inhibitor I42 family protein [Desulfovibrionaceae bacterium]
MRTPAALTLVLILAPVFCSCSAGPTWLGGGPSETMLCLDGEQSFSIDLGPGDVLVLDMRDPGSGGYRFVGALFDPRVLRLDKVLNLPPESGLIGDFGRARYQFLALAPGETEVQVKIKRPWDANADLYKRVTVRVAD